MIAPEFCKLVSDLMNMRAAMEGAGIKRSNTNYPNFTPFDALEIDVFLGLFLANRVVPKPNIAW